MSLRVLSLSLFAGMLLLSAPVSLLAAPQKVEIGRNATICCTAGNNQTTCGNIVPPQCSGRLLKVYNRDGLLVREIPAPMTQEEINIAAARKKKEQEEEAAKLEQVRRDRALLATYTNLAEIDRMQKYTESSVNAEINNILAKIGAAKKKKQDLEQEAAFYSSQSMPAELSQALESEEMELKTQNELLVSKRAELEQIRKRFSSDRLRYIELTSK